MINRIIKNRIYRKLAVFALSFLVVSLTVIIQAACPEAGFASVSVFHPTPSVVTVSGSPVPAALTDKDLNLQLEALGLSEPAVAAMARPVVVNGSRGPYKNTAFSQMELPLSEELQRYTYDRCEALGLEYEMILAIMWRESRFQQQAVGTNRNGTQDSGLMQINDVNRGWLLAEHGIDNLLDPYQNIDAGTAILAEYFSKYDESFALMAYQYGEQGMLDKARQGMSTNDLTVKVQNKRDEFKRLRLGA